MFGVLKIGKLGASMKRAGFNPRTLFSASEPGAWYDPSDMSTLFQDSAGTVPVTAVEQPVGRILDKSGRGNHATQSTTTKRPVYSRLVNQMVGSEAWNKMVQSDGVSAITQETTDIPSFLGATSVARVTRAVPAAMTWYQYALGQPVAQGAINTRIFHFKPVLNCLRVKGHTSAGDPFYFAYDLQTKVMTVGTNAGSAKVDELPNGWLRFSVTQKVAEVGTSRIFAIAADAVVANDPAVFLTTGYDSRLATDAHLPYQWVNTATDYDADPSKFPAYRRADGVDDSLASSTGGGGTTGFFFSAAIGPQGSAGTARTLFSDAGTNTGYIVRLNASNQLELAAGNGTAYTTIATSGALAVGTTNVIQAWDDGTNLNVKIGNGATASIARPVVSAGTAGYTMGQDNGASTGYFNGRIYSTIYRKDSAPTQAQREAVALYQRQKAKLP